MAGTIPPPPRSDDEPSSPTSSGSRGPTGTLRPPPVSAPTPYAPAPRRTPLIPPPPASHPTTPKLPPVHAAPVQPVPIVAPVMPAVTYNTGAYPVVPDRPTMHSATPVGPAPALRSTGEHPIAAPPSVTQPGATASTHATGLAMTMPGWTPPAAQTVTVRSQRGDYVIGPQVGAGSFGAVYECLGPFDQRYALKVLRPSGRPIERVREDWSSEVRRLLQLRHPNVVYIHDAFEWESTFCVALEWCDHTLHDMLEQPLQEELAIELFRQMLAAVQYLHDWDLVHDDLHPGNVLIQQADRPIVKLSDFGISAELRGAPTVRPEIVHHAIMAPELIAAGYTSKQSDLYQLGMVMYWMITGRPPLDRHVPYEMLVRQISEGVARQRAEQLGTPLGSILAKMLRRRDAYRYTSAREVWMDMRTLPAWQGRQIFHVR